MSWASPNSLRTRVSSRTYMRTDNTMFIFSWQYPLTKRWYLTLLSRRQQLTEIHRSTEPSAHRSEIRLSSEKNSITEWYKDNDAIYVNFKTQTKNNILYMVAHVAWKSGKIETEKMYHELMRMVALGIE